MDQENKQHSVILEAEKQEFLAVLSHELRSPLTAVKGYLSMVLDGDEGKIGPEIRKSISAAFVANERSIKLIESMIKVVQIQEEQLKFTFQKVDLVQTIQILVHDFEVPAKEKNIQIIYQLPPMPVLVTADPDRTREVLSNILSNAVKFTRKGTVTIDHRSIPESEGMLEVVDIADTGVGIAKENQSRIFNIFTKENLSLANQEKGTGLGLFTASKIAEAQGGRVWLEKSEPGLGSTFSVAFKEYNG